MKVLVGVTYYRPHVSGLTIYVERLARSLAERGHTVTVLAAQYDPKLPRRETLHGVDVIRVPVALRVSKGVIMPTIGWVATQLVPKHDVVSLHLPQFDATGIGVRGRLWRKPVVITYHSDLILPPSPINWLAQTVSDLGNDLAAHLSDLILAYTDDFAKHSRYLSKYLDKVKVIPPPVEMPVPDPAALAAFRAQYHLESGGPVIGTGGAAGGREGRGVSIGGAAAHPGPLSGVRLLHAGPKEAIGETAYMKRLERLIEPLGDRYTFLAR